MFNPLAKPLDRSKDATCSLAIGLARSFDDLNQAFSLTYAAYHKAGLATGNPSALRLTPFHLLESSEVVIAKLDDEVVSTISIFGDGELGLPMQTMYPKEIQHLRSQGLRIAEIGSLADRRKSKGRFIRTFAEMGRLIAQAATFRNMDAIVAVAHPKHARLYKRVLGFQQIGGHTDCPYANGNPAEALYLNFHDFAGTELHHQFFAHPYSQNQLEPYCWDKHTQKYFQRVLEFDGKIANAIGLKGYYDWGNKSEPTPLNLTGQLSIFSNNTVH